MAQSPFEIPSPVLEKLDELNEIVKDHPVYIPPAGCGQAFWV